MGHPSGIVVPALAAFAMLLQAAWPDRPAIADPHASRLSPLRVSLDGRRLESSEGPVFFLAGDVGTLTAEAPAAIARLAGELAERGFTAVYATLQVECAPEDECRPPSYAAADSLVQEAAARGLYVALHLALEGAAPRTPRRQGLSLDDNAAADVGQHLARSIASRYRAAPHLAWVLGGQPRGARPRFWSAVAAELADARRGAPPRLVTWSPETGTASGYPHEAPWLDFALAPVDPSAAWPEEPVLDLTAREPRKPVIAIESAVTEPPAPDAIRQAAYAAVFAGAGGYITRFPDAPFDQLFHLRRLVDRRDRRHAAPAPDLLLDPVTEGARTPQALSGPGREWALVFVPAGAAAPLVAVDRLGGSDLGVFWFDPRTGNDAEPLPVPDRTRPLRAIPPDPRDWVLVLQSQ